MKPKLLLYCTKAKELLWFNHKYSNGNRFFMDGAYNRILDDCPDFYVNGKIVAECDFEVEDIELVRGLYIPPYLDTYNYVTKTIKNNTLVDKACLTYQEMEKYFGKLNYGGKNGYAIHLKNLHIFDTPKELSEYDDVMAKPLNKAPQNMIYAFKYFPESMHINNQFQEYILISIQPQWLCKILNGDKTIEVRKKVLKEML